jgi:hypothetical protein
VLGKVKPALDMFRKLIHNRLLPNWRPFRGTFEIEDEKRVKDLRCPGRSWCRTIRVLYFLCGRA